MESKKKLLIADADESFRSILMDAMRDECKRAQFSQKTRFLCQRCDGCNKMHK